jgi:hypothetical protein
MYKIYVILEILELTVWKWCTYICKGLHIWVKEHLQRQFVPVNTPNVCKILWHPFSHFIYLKQSIWRLFKKFRNFYHKTFYISSTHYLHLSSSKHSHPLLIHHPPKFLPLFEAVLNTCFSIAFRSLSEFSFISSMVSNLRPFKVYFSLRNRKKSAGARFGE